MGIFRSENYRILKLKGLEYEENREFLVEILKLVGYTIEVYPWDLKELEPLYGKCKRFLRKSK